MSAKKKRKLDAHPDTLDFRDRMFESTLVGVPTAVPLDSHARFACTIELFKETCLPEFNQTEPDGFCCSL